MNNVWFGKALEMGKMTIKSRLQTANGANETIPTEIS